MRTASLVAYLCLATSSLHARIVFSSHRDDGRYEIFTMDINDGEPIQITNNRHHSYSPTWSPDGRRLRLTGRAISMLWMPTGTTSRRC